MPTGIMFLLVVAALVYFGVSQRLLDRMRLTDTQALLFIGFMIVGSFINIPLYNGATEISINLGGAIAPLALVIYLLSKAGSTKEWVRALMASVITAAVVFGISQLTDFDPPSPQELIDPLWLYSIVAGVVGYLSGRSRRSAFIAGVLGILLNDIAHVVLSFTQNYAATISIGGAGIFDSVVLSGLIAIALAEFVGETRERLQGGPKQRAGQEALVNAEFVNHNSDEQDNSEEEQ